jgi:hypothetical protein
VGCRRGLLRALPCASRGPWWRRIRGRLPIAAAPSLSEACQPTHRPASASRAVILNEDRGAGGVVAGRNLAASRLSVTRSPARSPCSALCSAPPRPGVQHTHNVPGRVATMNVASWSGLLTGSSAYWRRSATSHHPGAASSVPGGAVARLFGGALTRSATLLLLLIRFLNDDLDR